MIARIKDWINSFFSKKENRTRLIMTVFGVVVSAISVGFFRQAAFGTDPFQCMCAGLDNVIPKASALCMSLSTWCCCA